MKNLREFADKTTARQMAIKANVPVVPGTDGPIDTLEEALDFVKGFGYPIIIKVRPSSNFKTATTSFIRRFIFWCFESETVTIVPSFLREQVNFSNFIVIYIW